MKPVKVLIMIDRLGRGGVAQVALNVALTIDRTKFDPIICITREKPAYGQDEVIREAGITLIELKRRSRLDLFSWRPLLKTLPTITILHTHLNGSNFWGRIWGRFLNVPIIITQEHTTATEKGWIAHYINRILSPFSDKIVTVSEYDRELLIQREKLPPDKVTAIYVGIDTEKFDCKISKQDARQQVGLEQEKCVIGIVGRLAPQKNHKGFFEALTLLPEDLKSKLHVVLVGSGDLEAELQQQVFEMGWQDSVSFLGERADVPVILRALDLLVLPSHWECLPSVISEALMSQCPIVATSVGGVPEMIGDIGWPLVKPRNPNKLAEAITQVLQMSPSERERIAALGRLRVIEKFSKEQSVAQLEALYESLLAPLPRRGVETAV